MSLKITRLHVHNVKFVTLDGLLPKLFFSDLSRITRLSSFIMGIGVGPLGAPSLGGDASSSKQRFERQKRFHELDAHAC